MTCKFHLGNKSTMKSKSNLENNSRKIHGDQILQEVAKYSSIIKRKSTLLINRISFTMRIYQLSKSLSSDHKIIGNN